MNYLYKISVIIIVTSMFLYIGCAKRSMVPFDKLPVPSEVELTTSDGQNLEAIALEKSSDKLIIQIPQKVVELDKSQIQTIHYYPPEYDESGDLITREEIAREKNHKNAIIYTIGGGALSFGASLFISSLVYRSGDDFKVINPISVGGSILGTGMLFWQGKKRDNMMTLERIKDQRQFLAEDELEEKRVEKEKLQKQLEELKKEKAR